jgi:hypothetical protein
MCSRKNISTFNIKYNFTLLYKIAEYGQFDIFVVVSCFAYFMQNENIFYSKTMNFLTIKHRHLSIEHRML